MKPTLFALSSLFASVRGCPSRGRSMSFEACRPIHSLSLEACHKVPGWNTQRRSLIINPQGSVVHYDSGTNTIPRSDVADAVQRALDGEDNAEELTQIGNDTLVFDLTRNDMVVRAPNGLDDEFVVQNAFVVDNPAIVYKVECPAKSAGAVCQVKELTGSDGLDFCSLRDEDIPIKCKDQMYNVGLYAIKGPHFVLGASPQGGRVRGNDCPQIIAFDKPNGEKKKLSLLNMGDINDIPVHMLGSTKLGAIIKAEEQAVIDDSKYNLASNTCVHYAGEIWRSLEFEETTELAGFIIDNVMNDNNFENLAKKHSGGLRYLAAKTIGGKTAALGNYVEDIVYSQLDIVNV